MYGVECKPSVFQIWQQTWSNGSEQITKLFLSPLAVQPVAAHGRFSRSL